MLCFIGCAIFGVKEVQTDGFDFENGDFAYTKAEEGQITPNAPAAAPVYVPPPPPSYNVPSDAMESRDNNKPETIHSPDMSGAGARLPAEDKSEPKPHSQSESDKEKSSAAPILSDGSPRPSDAIDDLD
jgi:hypothetical protein